MAMDMNLDKEMSTRGLLDCINNKSMNKVLGSKWTGRTNSRSSIGRTFQISIISFWFHN